MRRFGEISELSEILLRSQTGGRELTIRLSTDPGADRVYELPSTSDTLVGKATVDTLTNKVIDGSTNTIQNVARGSLAAGTANHVVVNDGSGDVSSEAQLAITRGGTGESTANAGFNALSPLTTDGDLIVQDSGIAARLAQGGAGTVLTSDGDGTYSWTAPLTNPMGNPGELIYGVGGGAPASLAAGTSDEVLVSGGAGSPVWGLLSNSNIDAAAAIAGSKITPNFGSQNILSSGSFRLGSTSAPSSPNGRTTVAHIGDSLVFDSGSDGVNRHELGVFGANAGEALQLLNETTPYMHWQMSGGTAGNIGMGTTNPLGILHIEKNVNADLQLILKNPSTSASGAARMTFDSNSGSCFLAKHSSTNSSRGGISSFNIVNVSGGVYLSPGATTWTSLSDMRHKTKIADFTDGLNKILNLSTFTYTLDEDTSNKVHLGLSAQEVLSTIPEVVEGSVDTRLGLNYTSFVPVLIDAIKGQNTLITNLEARIATLEAS